jgi:hypothetical protein
MNMKTFLTSAILFLALISIESCSHKPSQGINQDIPWANYLTEIDRYQMMLDSTIMYLESNGDRYGIDKLDQFLIIDQKLKQELVGASSRIMSYLAHLDFIRYANQGFYHQFPLDINFESFINYYFAFLIQSTRAVNFINIIERNQALPTILNEAYPEYGLAQNSYTEFKNRFLSPAEAVEFGKLQIIYREYRPEINPYYRKIAMLEGYNLSQGIDYGVKLSFDHAQSVVEKESFMLWYPIQKDFAVWMSTMQLFREGRRLISSEDVGVIKKQLLPGDIFFQRREWNFTNAGIPGYWTHAAFFIGDSIERSSFASDDSIKTWVKTMGIASGSFEELLRTTYPVAYEKNNHLDDSMSTHSVIEALKPGVVLQTLETSLDCDGVGVLRPRLSELGKAQSIFRSLQYYGRAYDYNFDFLTDSTLVCSELVYKSFQPNASFTGIPFNTENVAGRIMIPANKMVKQFDREYDTINLDFVLFYDGNEMGGNSTPKDEETFRASWRRLGIYPLLQSELLMLDKDF